MSDINEFKGEFRFLSNFYPCLIEYKGIKYPTSEHAFQAAKSPFKSIKIQISNLKTPGDSKRKGRSIEIKENWESIKVEEMIKILKIKFKAGSNLSEKLLKTRDKILIEGNYWHDNFWGNCYCKQCENKPGKNALGKILMKIRLELNK